MCRSNFPGWIKRLLLVIGFLALGLMGCASEIPTEIPSTVSVGALTPYWTITPTETQLLPPSNLAISPTATKVPSPTPTPVTYKVAEGDTLTSIAYQHGVKLNDLLAANPGVDPNFLTIGIAITIPINNETSSAFPSPTPIALVFSQPKCYPSADQGLWCLFLTENNQPFSVENISGLISLSSPDFDEVFSGIALTPLNILHPGQRLPLMVYFHPKVPRDPIAQAEIITLLPVPENDDRYLNIEIQTNEISISPSRLSATITGEIQLNGETDSESKIWLAVIVYDSNGNPVGVRRWENQTAVSQNNSIHFKETVFSLGPPIEFVDVLGEALP
jgi:LysM repeat protein